MMGNNVAAEVQPNYNENRNELNLSQHLSHKELCQHLEGKCSASCISAIPWHVLDATWMYERLLVSCNCLTSLPPELPLRLPHLTYLDLNYNHISALPNSIGLFIHLRTLLLRHNNVEALPNSLGRLVKLKKLDVSHNKLIQLPAKIGELPKLAKLNVSHNQLLELPRSLGRSARLKIIIAQGNMCSIPPQDLCESCDSESLLKYLRRCCELESAARDAVLNNNKEDSAVERDRGLYNVFHRVRANDAVSLAVNPHSQKSRYVQTQTQTTHTASRIKIPLLPPPGSTSFSMLDLGDRITGLLYGAVIGDALGIGTEFMSPDECKFHYNDRDLSYDGIIQDEHTAHWRQGQWTSNSDQMFLALDSVLHWAGMVDELDFAERLLHWKNHGFSDLDESEEYMLSETINEVLKVHHYATDPHSAAINLLLNCGTNGNSAIQNGTDETNQRHRAEVTFCDSGALPRALVLGIIQFHNLKEVVSNSVRICIATHADERCVAASVALSILVALLLQGKYINYSETEFEEILAVMRSNAVQHLKQKDYITEFDKYMDVKDYKSIQLHERGRAHFVLKPLAAAILALKSNQDMQTALADVILQGGHGSMNGCITGALLGCATGFSKLPERWISGLLPRNVAWLNGKINSLLDKMGLP